MSMHPALKVAKQIFRKAGIQVQEVGALSFHVVCKEWNERPLIVDLKLSSHENKGRIEVLWLCDEHTMYAQAMQLHGQVFEFA